METWNRLTVTRRGWRKGIMEERKGRDYIKNMYEWPMDMDNGVELTVGVGGWDGHIITIKGDAINTIEDKGNIKLNVAYKKLLKQNKQSGKI